MQNIEENENTQDNIENNEISAIMKKEEIQNNPLNNNNNNGKIDDINFNDDSKLSSKPTQFQKNTMKNTNSVNQLPDINQNQRVGQQQQYSTNRGGGEASIATQQYTAGSSILNNSVNQLKLQQQFLYGNGLTSDFQSSSSLQHSISSITFPKANRFSNRSNFSQFNEKLLDQKDSLSKRATSFGYGEKNKAQNIVLRNAAKIPGPAKYNLSEEFVNINQGKSFGHSFKHYEKVFYPGLQKTPSLETTKEYPGPGQYSQMYDIGSEKQKYTIGSKLKINYNLSHAPPPNYYNPKSDAVLSSRYRTITFGQSNKFTNDNLQKFPGPGTYSLPSVFDRFHKKY